MPLRPSALCLLIALAAPIAAHADSPPQPVPADGQCAVPADPAWTKQEQFVWLNVCVGNEADFNTAPDYGGDLDPKSTDLPDSRILRPSFLETILLETKYRNVLTRLGVRIAGARFTEMVDLRNAELAHELWLDHSLLEKGANLQGVKTSRRITFDGAKVLGAFNASRMRIEQDFSMHGAELSGGLNLLRTYVGSELDLSGTVASAPVNMNTIDVGRTVLLRNKAHFTEIDLAAAHVGALELGGSTVTGSLSMSGIRVDQDLFMHDKAQFNTVDLASAHVGGGLYLGSATVAGLLNMNGIRVDQHLFMHDKAQFHAIDLVAAHIGGLELGGSTVTGLLNMNYIQVDQDLFMRDKAQFKDVNLAAAHIAGAALLNEATIDGALTLTRTHIDGELNLSGATVVGLLNLNSIRVEQSLFMRDKARFAEINLVTAHIGGQLDLNTSTVTGLLEGNYANVEQTAFFGRGATFDAQINLVSTKFGEDLNLSGGTFNKNVNLTGTQIAGVLQLESARWLHGATLNLNHGSAGVIDLSDNWPDDIFLNGFTYRNLLNLAKYNGEQAATWFGKQAYAPQPYEQLATVLQANGLIDDATDIRYAGKDREYQAATGLRRAWLFLLKYSIGFGYHLEYAFAWAAGFVLLGWAVLYATGQRTKHGTTLGLVYSFDMLLPLVQLDKTHDDVALDPWPRRYFYVHKIVGVLLASFIAAGISGLTK